jgi:hypothetical protein
MKELVLVLREEDVLALGALRRMIGLRVARQGSKIWLRGIPYDQALELEILQLPAIERYALDPEELLFLPNALTPIAFLPQLQWQLIKAFLPIEAPIAGYGGQLEAEISVELVPSAVEAAPAALLCRLSVLQAWAHSSAAARIHALRFVAESSGQVIVSGEPLPSLPGQSFWQMAGLYLPAGFALAYPILASSILKRLDPNQTKSVFLHANAPPTVFETALFVQATRSGIRQTSLQP